MTIGITESASEEPERTSDDEGDLDHTYNGAQNITPIFFIKKVK